MSDSFRRLNQSRPVIVVVLRYTNSSTAHDSQHQEDLGRWVKARISGILSDVACIHVQAESYYHPAIVLQLETHQRAASLLCVLSCFANGRRRAWRALKVVGHAIKPICSYFCCRIMPKSPMIQLNAANAGRLSDGLGGRVA